MIRVFYDGKCGLCSKEINHYRKTAPAGIFDWQDITKTPDALRETGISVFEALRRLHAQDRYGRLHVGVDAFVLIWKQLKYWRFLAFLVSLPLVRQVAGFVYRAFADWRFKRLAHCQLAQQQDTPQ